MGVVERPPLFCLEPGSVPVGLVMTFAVVILAAYVSGMGYILVDRLLED